MFKGSMVALVTPMNANGTIDHKSLHDLVEWHIESKTQGIIVTGTTGEAATLSDDEQFEIVSKVVAQVSKRIPVIAGTGTNSTHHTIKLTELAKNAGADAALIVTPYYNRPTQLGLFEHYKKIAQSVTIPIIVYNVPSRTACDILPETVEQLAKFSNIMAIKEASGIIERAKEIINRCGPQFGVYSGIDALNLDLINEGAHGVISVTANVAPKKMQQICAAALNKDMALAKKIDAQLMPLHEKLFLESNPIPIKWALNQMGLIPSGIRLPLSPFDPQFHEDLKSALRHADIKLSAANA